MLDEEYIGDSLEKLIALCREGENAYREASTHVSDSVLKSLLNEVSRERAHFAQVLQDEALRWGRSDLGRPANLFAAAHRVGVGLRAAIGGDRAILSALESSDHYLQDRLDDYIRDARLPDEVLGIVRNQAQAIVGTLDRIRALRQRPKAA